MRVLVGKDENEWTDLVWTWFHAELRSHDRVFIPSGRTALPFYHRAVREPSALLRALNFLQLDEILTGPLKGSFREFFEREMAPFISQFEWVTDAGRGCDACVLGVGINGHVAFHEPGLPRDFSGGCVRLSAETEKYLGVTPPTWAVTYGVRNFEQAKKVLILARGDAKKKVLEQALRDGDLPVSWMLKHPNVTLITDFKLNA